MYADKVVNLGMLWRYGHLCVCVQVCLFIHKTKHYVNTLSYYNNIFVGWIVCVVKGEILGFICMGRY